MKGVQPKDLQVSSGRKRFDEPIPPKAVCAKCRRRRTSLQTCCLTGSGDHPRWFILCANCIEEMIAKSLVSEEPSSEEHPSAPTSEISESEMRLETRRQRAFNRLGTDHPVCVCCPETDWRCMELHHLEGKDFGKTLIRVCRNCHRKLSDSQKDHPAKLGEPPLTLEAIARHLRGLGDALPMIADQLVESAEALFDEAQQQLAKRGRDRK